MNRSIKIALAQMQMTSDMNENLIKTIKRMQEASMKGVDLICFPEVQLSPFFAQYPKKDVSSYVINIDSPYVKKVCSLCKELKLHASPNFYIEENGKRYDMSLLIDDEGHIIGKQKMVHIAQCEKFYEQDYYTPSEEGFHVFDTRLGKIGIVVCFDRHYPESIRTEALRGAELIIIPTANTKEEPSELFQWEVKIQAFQNSVNIAMCNRVGVEGEMEFSGESIVTDYNGQCIALAGDKEELVIADLNLNKATSVRELKPYTSLRIKKFYE
ncbi:carbon-nitrogen hydrolase [Neocallimastix lanati (nom. inval.)]|nr:carbon-nitrogen hydrolase [Neocallimastix sp. JGI-2020a]